MTTDPSASVTYVSDDVVEVRSSAVGYLQGRGAKGLVGMLLASGLIAAVLPHWWKLLAGVLPVMGIYVWIKTSEAADSSDKVLRIDRAARTARTATLVVNGRTRRVATGALVRVEVFEPMSADDLTAQRMFAMRLWCEAGLISLFMLRSEEQVGVMAEDLAAWAQVPRVDRGRLSLLELMETKPLV